MDGERQMTDERMGNKQDKALPGSLAAYIDRELI
jgi:hypothetical protein